MQIENSISQMIINDPKGIYAKWNKYASCPNKLGHLYLMAHMYVGKWISIDSAKGLSGVRRQAITWTRYNLLSVRTPGIKFNEILIEVQNFSFMNMHL